MASGIATPERHGNRPTQLNAEHDQIIAEAAPYEAEFDDRGGWSRFFHVQGGHIHKSMGCSTCRPTTQFGWLPKVSGKSEAEAVQKYGAILCTVCYPSAPVEWTNRLNKEPDDRCPADQGWTHKGRYHTCNACGTLRQPTASGNMPKHKRPK